MIKNELTTSRPLFALVAQTPYHQAAAIFAHCVELGTFKRTQLASAAGITIRGAKGRTEVLRNTTAAVSVAQAASFIASAVGEAIIAPALVAANPTVFTNISPAIREHAELINTRASLGSLKGAALELGACYGTLRNEVSNERQTAGLPLDSAMAYLQSVVLQHVTPTDWQS